MAANHYFYVMSNDGSTTLFTSANTVSNDTTITVTETGLTIGTETYTYSGDKKFIGVSGTSGTTAPALAIGDSFTGAYETVYIVEAEAEETSPSGVTVEYNGSVVTTIPNGNKATIPIANKKMKTDIVITVPKAEGGGTDSPLPIEVSTEAEMTALLESGEVGGVYKYTGTTGTYENGALYVLENSTGTFTILSSNGTEKGTYTFDIGMTFADFVASDYNTNNVFEIYSTSVLYNKISIVGVEPSSIISEGNYSLNTSGGA